MLRSIILGLLLIVTPLSASAQTVTLSSISTTTLSAELRQILETILPLPSVTFDVLSPEASTGAAERLKAALSSSPALAAPTPPSSGVSIATLLAQVAVLQKQIDTILASTTPSPIPGNVVSDRTPGAMPCPLLTRTLFLGMQGSEVIELQTFLISEGLLGVDVATGFFGSLTEKAVQAWQAAKNVITEGTPSTTGYGSVGPQTRATFATCR